MSRNVNALIAVLAVAAATFGAHDASARGGGGGGGGGFSGGSRVFSASVRQVGINTFRRNPGIGYFPHNPDRLVRFHQLGTNARQTIYRRPLVASVNANLDDPKLVLPRVPLRLPPRQLTPQGYPGGSLGLRLSAGGRVEGGDVDCGPRNCVPKNPGRIFDNDGGGSISYLGYQGRYSPPGHYANSNNNGGCVGNAQCGMPTQASGPPSGGAIDNGSAGVPAAN